MVQQLKLRLPQPHRQPPNQKQQRLPSPRHPQLQLLLQHPQRHLHLLLHLHRSLHRWHHQPLQCQLQPLQRHQLLQANWRAIQTT